MDDDDDDDVGPSADIMRSDRLISRHCADIMHSSPLCVMTSVNDDDIRQNLIMGLLSS